MKTGLELARFQVEKRFNEAKSLLEKTFEEVSYEELKELCGFADGLEYALVVLDAHIEYEKKPLTGMSDRNKIIKEIIHEN